MQLYRCVLLQEAYFRYMAENPNAGVVPEEEEDNLEYDSDGNPIAPSKKIIDPLPPIDHSEVREFYPSHWASNVRKWGVQTNICRRFMLWLFKALHSPTGHSVLLQKLYTCQQLLAEQECLQTFHEVTSHSDKGSNQFWACKVTHLTNSLPGRSNTRHLRRTSMKSMRKSPASLRSKWWSFAIS